MSWRERIQAARERGEFTYEDRMRAVSCSTCAVGEAARDIGIDHNAFVAVRFVTDSPNALSIARHLSVGFTMAVINRRFDEAERLLDEIEDRALAIKRGATP